MKIDGRNSPGNVQTAGDDPHAHAQAHAQTHAQAQAHAHTRAHALAHAHAHTQQAMDTS